MMLPSTDTAWLAGVIDGEGCLTLRRNGSGAGFSAALYLDNNSLALIEKADNIIRTMGITPLRFTPRPAARNRLSRKPLERLYVMSKDIYVILSAVLPYLVTEKREFAIALIAFSKTRTAGMAWTESQVAAAQAIRAAHMPRSSTERAIRAL